MCLLDYFWEQGRCRETTITTIAQRGAKQSSLPSMGFVFNIGFFILFFYSIDLHLHLQIRRWDHTKARYSCKLKNGKGSVSTTAFSRSFPSRIFWVSLERQQNMWSEPISIRYYRSETFMTKSSFIWPHLDTWTSKIYSIGRNKSFLINNTACETDGKKEIWDDCSWNEKWYNHGESRSAAGKTGFKLSSSCDSFVRFVLVSM